MSSRVHRVETPHGQLCVESTGPSLVTSASRLNAAPVVMLHGFTGAAESMQAPAAALEHEFEVHRVELVGHGRSDSPGEVGAYSMSACVTQLGYVFDALGLEDAHVYGYSMGGRTALSLAVAQPDRVRSLLLVGATAGLASDAERTARIAADEALAQRILDDGVAPFVDAWMANPLFASQRRLGTDALARARAQRLCNRALGLANSLRGMGTGRMPPLHTALGDLHRPVHLVVGAEDAKFEAIAQALAAMLPDATMSRVPEAGHAAHLEQPERVGRIACEFFRAVDARARDRRSA